MTRCARMLIHVMLAALWLPVAGIAGEAGTPGNPATGTNEPQSKTVPSTGAASKDQTVKKSDPKGVQSRGLFSKKKKKQAGGAAGHSQPAEKTDPPAQ